MVSFNQPPPPFHEEGPHILSGFVDNTRQVIRENNADHITRVKILNSISASHETLKTLM